MILVAGATGFLGRSICGRLGSRGQQVRALVRTTSDPAAVGQLAAGGAELALGDLKDPESLRRACDGVDAVVSTATATRSRGEGDGIEASDRQGQLDLVEAAREAGVGRFLLVSYTGLIDSDDPLTRAKREVEAAVRESGMSYTILRPGIFMESWLSPPLGFDYPNLKATVYGAGRRPISWISLEDVAEYAVRALQDPAAENATLELGGPEALSPLEVVRIFEEVGGVRFEVQLVPEEALRAQAAAAPDSLGKAFAALMLAYAAGADVPVNGQLGSSFPLRTVRDYARQVLSTRVPAPAAP
jgi:uncharacterized protein YbjT (DUF2867 family)